MSSHIARIEIYPDYDFEGRMDLNLPFSYGCPELNLMGYMEISEFIKDVKFKLLEEGKWKKEEKR